MPASFNLLAAWSNLRYRRQSRADGYCISSINTDANSMRLVRVFVQSYPESRRADVERMQTVSDSTQLIRVTLSCPQRSESIIPSYHMCRTASQDGMSLRLILFCPGERAWRRNISNKSLPFQNHMGIVCPVKRGAALLTSYVRHRIP
jgi:hypothetical protein